MLGHGGSINESAAHANFAQLAGGLDAPHRADVVHGALSPRTIWVGPSSGKGVAYVGYLMGFGSSLLLRERLAHEARGDPLDDLLYVAPEQLRGEPVTRASDQYALACALYHTLVGTPPFERDSRSKLYGAHLMASPPALAAADPSAAAATSAALQRAMSKEPVERFATCGMLINAALADRGAEPVAAATAPAREHDDDAADRRPPWPLVLAGLGVVLVGLVLWLLLSQDGGTSSAADLPDDPAAAAGVTETAGPISPTAASSAPPADPSRWSTAVADAAVVALEAMDGVVLATDEDGGLTALRPAAGRVRWRADAGGSRDVAAGRGVVVHGGDQLTVLDRGTGEVRWSSAQAPTRSLHVADGAVVGALRTDTDTEVLAVGVSDGAERWHVHSPAGLVDERLTVEVGDDLTYTLQGGRLAAMDPATSNETAAGRQQISGPSWTVDVARAWPVLVATPDGVAIATRDGEVCQHGAQDGVVDWCTEVPGANAERPHLFATSRGVVATTSRAVIAVDLEVGAPSWSLSPGGPGNVVAASGAAVVVADGGSGIVGLDAVDGTELFTVADLGEVTALAAHERWLVVGTADGRVRRIDIDTAGGG
jgi:hypothetical protein